MQSTMSNLNCAIRKQGSSYARYDPNLKSAHRHKATPPLTISFQYLQYHGVSSPEKVQSGNAKIISIFLGYSVYSSPYNLKIISNPIKLITIDYYITLHEVKVYWSFRKEKMNTRYSKPYIQNALGMERVSVFAVLAFL